MSSQPTLGGGRIVAGIDGSPSSLDALAWAGRQAALTGSRLQVVMAWDYPTSAGWSVPVPDDYKPEVDVQRDLEAAVASVHREHPDLSVDSVVVEGHPAPILVETSRGADLLVVGSRGHGAFVGMLLGSVSEYCVTHAHCPVVVHRPAS
jgi:nucleotide-binding universal stress UspA family protein